MLSMSKKSVVMKKLRLALLSFILIIANYTQRGAILIKSHSNNQTQPSIGFKPLEGSKPNPLRSF